MVAIVSESRATDASLRALADAAAAAGDDVHWLVVGGHMVNLHVLRTAVDVPLRATRDADLAVELLTVRDGGLIARLRDLGYDNPLSANRFDRSWGGLTASIDVLVPSYRSGHVPNVEAGEIRVDALPVLHLALPTTPTVVEIRADLTDGTRIDAAIRVPDVTSAIALKVLAFGQRFAARDAEDIARLLEVAHADGVAGWPSGPTFRLAGRQLTVHFDRPGGALELAAPSPAARTRVRALVRALVGRPDRFG